jgi:hypothetical protein
VFRTARKGSGAGSGVFRTGDAFVCEDCYEVLVRAFVREAMNASRPSESASSAGSRRALL